MDYQSLTQIMTSKTLKKVTPFLVSVYAFSFIFFYSARYSFLLHYFKLYFSALPLQLVNHALSKAWIFLICNGILVILAKTSGMVHSPSAGFDPKDLLQMKIGDDLQITPDHDHDHRYTQNPMLEGQVLPEPENAVREEGEGEEGEDECLGEEVEENSCLALEDDEEQEKLALEDDEEQEKLEESAFLKTGREEAEELLITYHMGDEETEEESETTSFIVEEEEEEHQGMEKLSTEELNKKFEDFIRRMKEELRIEPQQQLVVVN